MEWRGVQPGDVFWDHGGGLIGFIIRHYTHNPYAHCGVFVRDLGNDVWETHEAYPGGLRVRHRKLSSVRRISRIWRNAAEQRALLQHSTNLVGAKYAYGELARIVLARILKSMPVLMVVAFISLALGFFVLPAIIMNTLLLAAAMRRASDGPRLICSNHVAQSVLAARPAVRLSYPTYGIWPGRLEQDLSRVEWGDNWSGV